VSGADYRDWGITCDPAKLQINTDITDLILSISSVKIGNSVGCLDFS